MIMIRNFYKVPVICIKKDRKGWIYYKDETVRTLDWTDTRTKGFMFNYITKYTSRQMKPKEQSKGNIRITSMFNNMNYLGPHRSVKSTRI